MVKKLADPCLGVITPARRSNLRRLQRGDLPYGLHAWPVAPPPPPAWEVALPPGQAGPGAVALLRTPRMDALHARVTDRAADPMSA